MCFVRCFESGPSLLSANRRGAIRCWDRQGWSGRMKEHIQASRCQGNRCDLWCAGRSVRSDRDTWDKGSVRCYRDAINIYGIVIQCIKIRWVSLVAYPNRLPVGWYVVICFKYMYIIIVVSHRGLMTICSRSRVIWVLHVAQKLENKKTTNSGDFLSGIPKYVTSWVACCNVYLICVCYHSGIIQRSHDNLFQKSCHLGATCSLKAGKQKNTKFVGFL